MTDSVAKLVAKLRTEAEAGWGEGIATLLHEAAAALAERSEQLFRREEAMSASPHCCNFDAVRKTLTGDTE